MRDALRDVWLAVLQASAPARPEQGAAEEDRYGRS
jgi:hypothetical protein